MPREPASYPRRRARGVDSPVHRRQRYQGKSRGRPRSQLTGWTGTDSHRHSKSFSVSPPPRITKHFFGSLCHPAPRRAGGGGRVLRLPAKPCDSGVSCWPGRAAEMRGSSRARCRQDSAASASDAGWSRLLRPTRRTSPALSPATPRSGQGSLPRARRGPVAVPAAGRADMVVSSGRRPGRSDGVGAGRQGHRTRLLAQPQAPGIPGAGPGRWPARPP